MASVNKVIIVGNLGRDPEMRTFPSGGQIANVTVATTDKWKDKQTGEMKEATEWHRVVFRDRLAEIASQYLRKGSQVYVEGSLRTRQGMSGPQGGHDEGGGYDGGGYEQAPRQVAAPARPAAPAAAAPAAPGPRAASGFDDMDDDIPF